MTRVTKSYDSSMLYLDSLVAEAGRVEERGVLDDSGVDGVDPDPLLGHVEARAPSHSV